MHILSFNITNIRSINQLHWSLLDSKIRTSNGWHVILGNNGSGKTSIIRSIALALIGPNDAQYLRQNWHTWVSKNQIESIIWITFRQHAIDISSDNFNHGIGGALIQIEPYNGKTYRPVALHKTASGYVSSQTIDFEKDFPPENHVWANTSGWFSTSFGPYRRFSGGDPKYLDAYHQNPKASPHISAFGEDAALGGALTWLRDQARPSRVNGKKIIQIIINLINSDNFLPNNIKLHEINEDEILFSDTNNNIIDIEQLGDGYRSALCILIELTHQLVLSFGVEALTEPSHSNEIIIPGVVLIDEVDAHLHPIWQQHIGFWLTSRFPNMQFIVTTHSPLICQAATTVYKLPTPGTDEEGRFLDDLELSRLRYGNIFEAYASEAFGKIDRSEEGKKKLERLADLTRFSWERDLTEDERREQAQLRAIFIDSPIGI